MKKNFHTSLHMVKYKTLSYNIMRKTQAENCYVWGQN